MKPLKWWQTSVFYQIYPRSFADSNGDGIGDLPGITAKLDYLKDLGIDAIWLSPHYPSPQFDCGYDVADYTAVEPEYGTLEDFKTFLEGAHSRGISVILDLVLNHTSHLHPWFLESRSSRHNPKRDWYIWRDGRDGGPPNNWESAFGGSAWEYDAQTDQYYYHYFFKEQPDLNWRNPEVKQAMFDAARFWLKLGVDGFRLDAIGTIFEHPDMPDHPGEYDMIELGRLWMAATDDEEKRRLGAMWMQMFAYQVDQPGMHELMQELRRVIDEFPDRMLVAEDSNIAYMGNGDNEMHLVFNFPLMRNERLTPVIIRRNQRERLAELAKVSPEAWACNTLGNHDSPRVFNRWGDDMHDAELARINLALMLTLKGTPFLYNGEEIGMTDYMLEDISQFKDLTGVWMYNTLRENGAPEAIAFQMALERTRDKNRTPMQWSNAPNAGFSPAGVQTWLPVNPNYAEGVNVAEQQDDPNSLLNFYRRMLAFRKQTPALIAGEYQEIHNHSQKYLAFLRVLPSQTCLVVLNYSNSTLKLDFSSLGSSASVSFSSRQREASLDLNLVRVEPFEVLIAQLP